MQAMAFCAAFAAGFVFYCAVVFCCCGFTAMRWRRALQRVVLAMPYALNDVAIDCS
jgi:hypothetical protein